MEVNQAVLHFPSLMVTFTQIYIIAKKKPSMINKLLRMCVCVYVWESIIFIIYI